MPLTLMNRHKKYLMALVLALAAMTMTATELSVESALATATRFMASKGNDGILSNHKTWQLAHIEHSTAKTTAADYYIFNASDGSAFVIIAGDDRANVVLAYGNGAIDMSNLPDNLRWMLNHYSDQIEHLINHPGIIPRQLSTPSTTVSQLINTEWGQRTPYRDLCPTVDGKPCITGCVATSMAQVMNYWKFPSVLPELPSYMTSELHIQVEALLPTSVEWDLMLDSYHEGTYTQDQGKAVATLMRYCGQASKMDYTIASSGALMSEQLKGLKIFGYNQGATYLDRSEYSDEDWTALLLDDLSASRPVIYSGMNYYTSHNFIIDGYDGSKFHVNWGWDGLYDGYFELDAMNGGGFTPSETHQMLHGVCPDEGSQNPQQYDFVKNGITYIILSDESVAICQNPNYKYSGDLIIPDTVRFSGKTYHVTAINEKAFASCTGLKSVVIPSSITSIGSNAFSRTGLSQVTIPSSVSAMGTAVFFNCTYLKHVELNHVITTIQDHMFEGCNALSSIVIPDEVTSICDNAFMKSGLTSIVIPDNVICIGTSAFEQCNKLSNVTIGCGISAISPSAFKECTALSAIELPQNVTDIGDDAFNGAGLKKLTIPMNINQIGNNAFRNCSSLTDVTLESASLSLGNNAFYNSNIIVLTCFSRYPPTAHSNCFSSTVYQNASLFVPSPLEALYRETEPWKWFSRIIPIDNDFIIVDGMYFNRTSDNTACLSLYNGESETVIIPDTLVFNDAIYTVTAVGYRAFENCQSIKTIVIPNTVTTIGNNAFNRCSNLSDITLSNSLTAIYDCTFAYCEALTSIEIPHAVNSIGNKAFWGSGLSYLVIPNNVTNIGNSAFKQCKNLNSITIGSGIRTINPSTFEECTALNTIQLPDNVTEIGDNAFLKSGLTGIVIPNNVTSIGNSAFKQCKSLNSITIGSGIRTINPSTFEECTALNTIQLPENVTDIGDNSFLKSGLSSIVIPDNVTNIGNSAFEQCRNLSSITIGSGIRSISSNSFRECISLDSIDLPNTLASISDNAFYGTGLKKLTIPMNVNHIGSNAFMNCSSLTDVTIESTSLSLGNSAFNNSIINILTCLSVSPPTANTNCFSYAVYENAALIVPLSLEGLYHETEPWKRFSKIIPIDDDFFIVDGMYFRHFSDHTACLILFKGENDTVIIPDTLVFNDAIYTVTSIGYRAFDNCQSLKTIVIPKSVKSIGDYAFNKCQSLSTITLPDSLQYLGQYAFANNSRLEQAILNKGLMTINNHAFTCCTSLRRIILPERLRTIGEEAFSLCLALDSITFPNSLSVIAKHAFNGCTQLTHAFISDLAAWCNIYFEDYGAAPFNYRAGHLYLNDHEINECKIPNGIATINDFAFTGCSDIKKVTLPNSITSIGEEAFCGCSAFTNVIIGTNTRHISQNAFKDCNSLSKVICQAQTPPTLQGNTVFNNNTYDEATLYVPFASIPDYLTANGWKLFANIESIDNEIITGDVNCDGEVNISDINSVLNMIMNGDPDSSGDVNDDQEVNINDINIIIQIIIDHCQPDPSTVAVKPVITYDEATFTVSAISPDNVVLMVNNEVVENPYTFKQTDEDTEYIVSAYSWAEGKTNSDYAWKRVLVPAPAHQSGYRLVLITANGEIIYYELQLAANGDNIGVFDLIYPEFINSCPFYFMINGIAYGAPEEMYEAVLGDPYMNPLVQGTCCYYVPTGYSYTIGVHYSNEEFLDGYYAYVAKGGLAGIEKDSSSKRLMKNPLKASNSLSPRW